MSSPHLPSALDAATQMFPTLTPAEIERFSGGKTLGRPHVARAIVVTRTPSIDFVAFILDYHV